MNGERARVRRAWRGRREDGRAQRRVGEEGGGSSARSRAHHLRRPEPRGARARTATRGRETSPNGSQKTRGPSNARQARAEFVHRRKHCARGPVVDDLAGCPLLLGDRPRSRPTSRGARPAAMFARRPPPGGDASDDSSDVFTDSEPDERGAGPPPSRARARARPRFASGTIPAARPAPPPHRSIGSATPRRCRPPSSPRPPRAPRDPPHPRGTAPRTRNSAPAPRRAALAARGFEPGASGSGSRRAPEGEGPHHRRPAQPPRRPPSSELLARTLGIPPGSVGERDDRDHPGFLDAEDASSPPRGGGGGRTVGASVARRSRRGRDAAPAPAPPPASESRRARRSAQRRRQERRRRRRRDPPSEAAFLVVLRLPRPPRARVDGPVGRRRRRRRGGDRSGPAPRVRGGSATRATWLVGLAALQFLGGFLAALWESGTQYAAPPHALPVASWGLACAAMDAFEDASDASGAGRGRTLFSSSSRGGASSSSRERGDGSRETAPHELFLAGTARRRRVAALAQATHCSRWRSRWRWTRSRSGAWTRCWRRGRARRGSTPTEGGARGRGSRRRKGTRRALRVGARGEGDREAQSGGGGEGAWGGGEGLGGVGEAGRRGRDAREELALELTTRRASEYHHQRSSCTSRRLRRALHSVARLRARSPLRSRAFAVAMRARGVSRGETRGDGVAERSSGSARSRARPNRATTGWARRVPDALALVAALLLALTLRERTRVPIHGCARARTRTTRRIPRTAPSVHRS